MNWEPLLTVAVALCCLLAVSTAATTLESSISTDPDDVIDIDSEKTPLGEDGVSSLKDQVQSDGTPNSSSSEDGDEQRTTAKPGEGDESMQTSDPSGSDDDESMQTSDPSGSDGGESKPADSGTPNEEQAGGDGTPTEQQAAGSGAAESGGGSAGPPSLLELLMQLLRELLALLLSLAPVLFGLLCLGLAVHQRERLWASIRVYLERWGLVDPADETVESPTVSSYPAPQNEVAEAWYEFADALGFGDQISRAPQECAAAARDAGVDEETIADVTEPFEEVRYGQRPVTDERCRRAKNGLERFRAQHGGGR
ncbi:DUF4129 domain-containing protein [Haloarchaeobius sp. DFWS5]|uniref:DUF4129 domain-containing protein n=1 Tax=Haloarchaeobius sp. DFWS5 TaxID=3446114 RepID=UPI003EBFFFA7